MVATTNEPVPAASNVANNLTDEDRRIASEKYGIINMDVVHKDEHGVLTYKGWMTLEKYVKY